jgi:hypothetical protein
VVEDAFVQFVHHGTAVGGGQINAGLPLFFGVAGDAFGAFDIHRISPMLGILREACA